MIWHNQSADAVAQELQTNVERGLTTEQALLRLQHDGMNTPYYQEAPPLWKLLLPQLKKLSSVFLLIAAALSFIYDLYFLMADLRPSWLMWAQPAIILVLLIVACVIGAIWERRSLLQLEALHKASPESISVLRDGVWQSLDVDRLVVGDILRLQAGDIVPADGRLLSVDGLECDEHLLSGEDLPVVKSADAIVDEITMADKRTNMVFTNCGVLQGTATAMVVEIGSNTEYSRLRAANKPEIGRRTLHSLRLELEQFGKWIAAPIVILGAVILLVTGLLCGDWMTALINTLTLTAAALPFCLSAVAIVSIVTCMRHASSSAIIKAVSAMDQLSQVSVICADKTGTLTKDKIRPVRILSGDQMECLTQTPSDRAMTLIRLATLCTATDTQTVGDDGELIGNPTEAAIIEYARNNGLDRRQLITEYPRLTEVPFDSDRKLMTVVHLVAGRKIVISMGAPEPVLACCTGAVSEAVTAANESMGRDALRVLAVAFKYIEDVPVEDVQQQLESGLSFAGLIGLADQPRADAAQAIDQCQRADIITVMMTGDHPVTAAAIAEQLGIMDAENQLVTGEQLAAMPDEELEQNIRQYRVFARIVPSDKLRIVKAWQKAGEVVAITGKGVQDVPALQQADIGCTTGIADCAMTRQASNMTLTDNNFASFVAVLKEARGIFSNIRKSIQYMLTCKCGMLAAVLLAAIAWGSKYGWALSPIQMLWFLIVGTVATLSLCNETSDAGNLVRTPRSGAKRMMDGGVGARILWQGALVGLMSFVAYDMGINSAQAATRDPALTGSTMLFVTLTLCYLWMAFSSRSFTLLLTARFAQNRTLLIVCLGILVLTIFLIFFAPLQTLFGLTALSIGDWFKAVGLSLVPVLIAEVVKVVQRVMQGGSTGKVAA